MAGTSDKQQQRIGVELHPVWPDGWIIFQYCAIYTNVNSPKSIKIKQRWYKMLSNTYLKLLEIAQGLT